MFQNNFEMKVFKNGGDITLEVRACWRNVICGSRCNTYRSYLKQTRLHFF